MRRSRTGAQTPRRRACEHWRPLMAATARARSVSRRRRRVSGKQICRGPTRADRRDFNARAVRRAGRRRFADRYRGAPRRRRPSASAARADAAGRAGAPRCATSEDGRRAWRSRGRECVQRRRVRGTRRATREADAAAAANLRARAIEARTERGARSTASLSARRSTTASGSGQSQRGPCGAEAAQLRRVARPLEASTRARMSSSRGASTKWRGSQQWARPRTKAPAPSRSASSCAEDRARSAWLEPHRGGVGISRRVARQLRARSPRTP